MNDFVTKAIDVVKDILMNQGGHNPTIFFLRDNELLQIAGFVAEEGTHPAHIWATLASKGVMMGANQYMLINEAYMTKAPIDADLSQVKAPSKDPNRVECVTISYFDTEESNDVMVAIPFVANNKGIEIKEPIIEDNKADAKLGGDMYEIFHNAIRILKKLESGEATPQQLMEESRKKLEQLEKDTCKGHPHIAPPQNPELN